MNHLIKAVKVIWLNAGFSVSKRDASTNLVRAIDEEERLSLISIKRIKRRC